MLIQKTNASNYVNHSAKVSQQGNLEPKQNLQSNNSQALETSMNLIAQRNKLQVNFGSMLLGQAHFDRYKKEIGQYTDMHHIIFGDDGSKNSFGTVLKPLKSNDLVRLAGLVEYDEFKKIMDEVDKKCEGHEDEYGVYPSHAYLQGNDWAWHIEEKYRQVEKYLKKHVPRLIEDYSSTDD